jgi:hypothetical protein
MTTHELSTMQRLTSPSGSSEWSPLERFIAHCACGFKTDECYPELQAEMTLAEHVASLMPLPTGDGKRPLKVVRRVFKQRRYEDDHYTPGEILVEFWVESGTMNVSLRPDPSATWSSPRTEIRNEDER